MSSNEGLFLKFKEEYCKCLDSYNRFSTFQKYVKIFFEINFEECASDFYVVSNDLLFGGLHEIFLKSNEDISKSDILDLIAFIRSDIYLNNLVTIKPYTSDASNLQRTKILEHNKKVSGKKFSSKVKKHISLFPVSNNVKDNNTEVDENEKDDNTEVDDNEKDDNTEVNEDYKENKEKEDATVIGINENETKNNNLGNVDQSHSNFLNDSGERITIEDSYIRVISLDPNIITDFICNLRKIIFHDPFNNNYMVKISDTMLIKFNLTDFDSSSLASYGLKFGFKISDVINVYKLVFTPPEISHKISHIDEYRKSYGYLDKLAKDVNSPSCIFDKLINTYYDKCISSQKKNMINLKTLYDLINTEDEQTLKSIVGYYDTPNKFTLNIKIFIKDYNGKYEARYKKDGKAILGSGGHSTLFIKDKYM